MDTARKPQDWVEYILPARTLSGTRADVAAQIDEFIQALAGLRLMLSSSPDSAASDLLLRGQGRPHAARRRQW